MTNITNSMELGTYPFVAEANLEDQEELVDTAYGNVKVNIYGEKGKQPIITFHDIGMNSMMNFENFFQLQLPSYLSKRFCVYNVNAPGQEIDSKSLPNSYVYPSMDGLANIIEDVVRHFGIKSFIGFGVGAGANVLLRYALNHPKKLIALILINPNTQKAGWIEWFYQMWNLSYLRVGKIKKFTIDYFMWHHFGRHIDDCNSDIVQQYRAYFNGMNNPTNLSLFIESYLNRNELILRDPQTTNDFLLNVSTLIIVGANSAFVDESVYLNSLLNPKNTEWLKISDSCGLVLDDKPEDVTQAFLLFMQGLGFCIDLNVPRIIASLRGELQNLKPLPHSIKVYENDEVMN